MKRTLFSIAVLAVTAISGFAQPTVGAIVNAGSYAVAGQQNAAIAEGSIFILFGTNMGPSAIQHAFSFPLPTDLAGTSVTITAGSPFHAIVLYTSAGQVAAVLPSATPTGPATLTVTYNGQTSAPLSFNVVQTNFGAFTANQGGSGAGIVVDGGGAGYTALRPATPGLQVALYGTGLGPIAGDETQPTRQQSLSVPLQVYVGTTQANVVFEGREGGDVGVDQINFVVPSGVTGCNVPVSVVIGKVVSNFSTIAVSSGGPCSDPGGVPPSILQQVSGKTSISIGSVFLTSIASQTTIAGQTISNSASAGGASFTKFDLNAFLQNPTSGSSGIPSIGGCLVTPITSSSSSSSAPIVTYTGLDAGTSIGLTGPNGNQSLNKVVQPTTLPGFYTATFPSTYLTGGNYTATGAGGADVGAFTASLSISNPLVWTNASSIATVNRSQGVTITWTGGDPNGYVSITGSSISVNGTSQLGGVFTCLASASAQTFTVPAPVLLSLPVSGSFAGVLLPGTLSVGSESYNSFTAPGLDYGVFLYLNETSRSVSFQ